MKLTFENSQGIERIIGYPDSIERAFKVINAFLQEHNYKSYYYRSTPTDDGNHIIVDVGSWSEFFHIYKEGDQNEI